MVMHYQSDPHKKLSEIAFTRPFEAQVPINWHFCSKKQGIQNALLLKIIICYRFPKNFSKIFAFTIDFLFFYDKIKTRFIKRKKCLINSPLNPF